MWWNYSWSTCFSFSLIGDDGQTWTYLNVSGRSSRITFVVKNFLQTGVARTLICGALCCNFFSTITARSGRENRDARTTSDSERLTQLLHTRVLEMIIYFLWVDATGKPANSQLVLKQCQAVHRIFWRLISKTCCSCPLLGPSDSILSSKWQRVFAVLQLRWYGMGNEHQDRHDTLSRQNTGRFFFFLSF